MGSNPKAFSEFEHEGWQRAAQKYERAWSGLTRLFIPKLLEAVNVKPGKRLLDVACGPGYAAQAASKLGAKAIGIDFSSEMIGLAKKRSAAVDFRLGDAQSLDFASNSFDAVVMNFGVLHLPNPEAAFAEACRVLRSGGRYGFTVWAEPEISPGAKIVEDAVEAFADKKVKLPDGPDYFSYCDPGECRKTLERAGFTATSMRFETVGVEWQVPTASFLFESELIAGVRTAALLAAQTSETLLSIQAKIEESVRAYAKGKGFAIPYTAYIIVITAP